MECPKCRDNNTKVVDSRPTEDGKSIRRRRECISCGTRFNTFERIEYTPLLVVKRDGTREEFNRDKLLRGVIRSAEKRPVSREQMDELVQNVEFQLRERIEPEVASVEIGELVMQHLMDLDEVAYIRFASVYREFQSKEMFLRELEAMEHQKSQTGDQ